MTRYAVEQDPTFIEDRLASWMNFCTMANLTEASDTPDLVEEDSGRSALVLASSSVLHWLSAQKEGQDNDDIL